MHPNLAFRPGDDDAMLDWAVSTGFAHIFAVTSAGPMMVHAPIVAVGARKLRFHVSRANRVTPHLDRAQILLSIVGADGYVTPNWYANPVPEVPTWNYTAVEIDGIASVADEIALIEQVDILAALHEPRVIPENPWTRDKLDPARQRAMLRAIIAFEVTVNAVRGTNKLSQGKSADDRARVIAGLKRSGNTALAGVMEA